MIRVAEHLCSKRSVCHLETGRLKNEKKKLDGGLTEQLLDRQYVDSRQAMEMRGSQTNPRRLECGAVEHEAFPRRKTNSLDCADSKIVPSILCSSGCSRNGKNVFPRIS